MPYVEEGLFIFIGATTENPYFAVNAPLISRSHVFAFRPLSVENLCQVLRQAMHHPKNILPLIEVEEDVLEFMALQCEGDARRAINILEFVLKSITVNTEGAYAITRENVEACVQDKAVIYDATGEDHYDTVSAFIKSMRGSDPDAALYWLAKMLYAGEDLNFIARRLVICASEDVGNADPQALVVANSTWDVVRKVGMPEARIPLAQAVVYVATAPKSNASYKAIDAALQYVKHHPILPVPKHLKDGHYKGAKALGHGVGYQYPHAHEDHYLQQEYAPIEESFYTPTEQGFERTIKERMKQWTKKNSE
jgi:putative ATPase